MYNILYNIDSSRKRLVTTKYVDFGTKTINGHKYMTLSFEDDGMVHTLRDVKEYNDSSLGIAHTNIIKLLCSGSVLDLTTSNWVDRTPGDLPGDVLDNNDAADLRIYERICDYFLALKEEHYQSMCKLYPTVYDYLSKRDTHSLSYLGLENVCEAFHDLEHITPEGVSQNALWLFNGYSEEVKTFIKNTYPPFYYLLSRKDVVMCTDEIIEVIKNKVSSNFGPIPALIP